MKKTATMRWRLCAGKSFLLVGILIFAFNASAQKKRANPSATGVNNAKDVLTQNAKPDLVPPIPPAEDQRQQLASKLAKSILSSDNDGKGDYLSCEFTLEELMTLSMSPSAPRVTLGEEELLKQRIIAAASTDTSTAAFQNGGRTEFIRLISESDFRNRTHSEVLALVIDLLQRSNASISMLKRATTTAELAQSIYDQLRAAGASPEVANAVKAEVTSANASPKSEEEFYGLAFDFRQRAAKTTDAKEKSALDATASTLEAAAGQNNSAAEAIVDAARNTLLKFERPTDVGCAMSILAFSETAKAYGRMVANEYIAVQVVVRNLNDGQDFILHDVELEVNADPSGRRGRFFSGHDKVVVRALSAVQQDFDIRNLIMHIAQGVGAIMGAVVPEAGDQLSTASGVYNGAFLTSLEKSWRDLSRDQLNLLNDTGFSSTVNARTVVPKSGTAMVVIFIPSKQFEQGWWTLPCASQIYVGSQDKQGRTILLGTESDRAGLDLDRALEACAITFEKATKATKASSPTSIGKTQESNNAASGASGTSHPEPGSAEDQTTRSKDADTETSAKQSNPQGLEIPDWWPTKKRLLHRNQVPKLLSVPVNRADDQAIPATDLFISAPPLKYKKWPASVLAIFRELALVAVAGSHIITDTELQPAVTEVNCPNDSRGFVDFTKATDNNWSCSVKGKNLDRLQNLRLRNAKDASDAGVAEGGVTVNGDPTAATVKFDLDSLGKLNKPDYNVVGVTKDGGEIKTDLPVLHFSLEPFVKSIDPQQIALNSANWPVTVALKGYHLDKALNVKLLIDNPKASTTRALISTAEGNATFLINSSDDLAKVDTGAGADLKISLIAEGGATIGNDVKIKLTGKLATSAPSAAKNTGNAPATKPKPKSKPPAKG